MSSISKDDLTVISRLFSKTEKTDEFELIISNHDNKYFGQEKYIQLLKYLKHRSLNIKTEIKNIDILKIDTQSHEDKVLSGARKSLKNKIINFIEAEVMLGQQYEKVNSFYKIEKNFSKNDYSLLAINNTGNLLTNKDFQLDVIYINKFYLKNSKI